MKRILLLFSWLVLLFISGKDYLHAGHDHAYNHGQHEYNGNILVSNSVCFACSVVLTTGETIEETASSPLAYITFIPASVHIATYLQSYTGTPLLRGPPAC